MKSNNFIEVELLRSLLNYDSDTGKLFWKIRPLEMFLCEAHMRAWNTRWAGKLALNTLDGEGYRQGSIFDRHYRAHRVIVAITTGEWPADQVDHDNQIKSDNKLKNLNCATNAQNGKNVKLRSNNTSGQNGVYWNKHKGLWQSHITVDGKVIHIGRYSKIEDAIAARRAADEKYGFNRNHGIIPSYTPAHPRGITAG